MALDGINVSVFTRDGISLRQIFGRLDHAADHAEACDRLRHHAAADQAVTAAKSYGLGAGTPIYYDMEAYNHTNAGCRTAVLTFLDAWTRQLKAVSYISGVYSSAGSAITDLQSNTTVAGHPLTESRAPHTGCRRSTGFQMISQFGLQAFAPGSAVGSAAASSGVSLLYGPICLAVKA